VVSFAPIVIIAIGDVCVNPAGPCPAGKIDCDGGAPLDTDVVADHNIGACTSNAGCLASCGTVCSGIGAVYSPLLTGCEGYCQGGANNELVCTRDTDCPGGSCVGGEPVGHVGTCNCVCAAGGIGAAAVPGGLGCNLGVQIDVELPSDGDCLDPDTIKLPALCGPVTTQTSVGVLRDANNTAAKTIPSGGASSVSGTAISCATLSSSTTTNMNVVGALGFFDSTLGDIFARLAFTCQ
jgi:hypothetical protein